MRRSSMTIAACLVTGTGWAGTCDSLVTQGITRSGADLVAAYADVVACDKGEAEGAFPRFMRASGDAETLVDLSLVAIDHEIYAPVWEIMEAVRDFGQRNAVALGIGRACEDHANVVPFLQGAYFALRGLTFTPWAKAIPECGAEALQTWATSIVTEPPSTAYDEKYAAVTEAVVALQRAEALPLLRDAAIAAANRGGPFDALLGYMDKAVEPEGFGTAPSPEDVAALQDALVEIGNQVGPDEAALVADRLSRAGADDRAASLLGRVYPGRAQRDGTWLYGAAVVEACDGQAVVHVVEVAEPGRRWALTDDLTEALQDLKPRLRCESPRPWPLHTTPGPVADASAVSAWAEGLVETVAADGTVEVRTRSERPITLP